MDFNKILQSGTFKKVLWALGGLIIVLLVFQAGMMIGFRKANFSYRWGENYHRNFGGPRGGFFKDFPNRDFVETFGTSGQIIKINPDSLIIKGNDDVEKVIDIKEKTTIRRFRDTIKINDLKIDDYIVVIGDPNDTGHIEAKLIRIMPAPPAMLPLSTPPPTPTKK